LRELTDAEGCSGLMGELTEAVAEADGPVARTLGCLEGLTGAEGCSGLMGKLTEADGCSGEAGAVAPVDGPVAGALDCLRELIDAEGCSGEMGLVDCSGLIGELTEADGCSGEAGAVATVNGPDAGTLGFSGFLGE
jgi:hypothetical protein